MVSCYEDDKIIPTEEPLASAGGIVFPQGNNSWDKDALDIYNQYGVKILYKDITVQSLGKDWIGSGAFGNGNILVQSCLNDEMSAFYLSFLKKHVFPYVNEKITERVLPMYWYMVYDYCSYTVMELGATKMETFSPKIKQDADKTDCWITCFWGSSDHNCLKMNGMVMGQSSPEGWRSPLKGDKESYKIRRLFILYDIINGAINKGNIPFPEKEFNSGFNFDKPVVTGNDEESIANEDYYLRRGFPGHINPSSTEYFPYNDAQTSRNPRETFINYVQIAMKFSKVEREKMWPSATYPFMSSKFEYITNYLKKFGVDVEAISQGPENWEIEVYPEVPQSGNGGNSGTGGDDGWGDFWG